MKLRRNQPRPGLSPTITPSYRCFSFTTVNALSHSLRMATPALAKAHLRHRLRSELKQMPRELRQTLSLRIAERITSFIRQVETVALFAPRPDEPNLHLLERFGLWTSRTILFPKLDAASLAFAPAETWEE